ncbi:hypothetical protein [Salidesulfovibrio brasiliensis]|uniref:hypothetical protein n=1 Tax=Salidesulfovibrio brasiliensis TaxID=221711 RepID=UPI0006D24085|nr:hypothetical protein [Salidesulfovibrio brasiliensis]
MSLTLDAPALANLAPSIDLDDTGQHYDVGAADGDSWGYNLLGLYTLDDDGTPVATDVLYEYSDVDGPGGGAFDAGTMSKGDLLAHVKMVRFRSSSSSTAAKNAKARPLTATCPSPSPSTTTGSGGEPA